MIAMRFRSVGLVAGVAVAALACYLVTQRVASERAHLGQVERQILVARRDIRQLETEIDTRGRLSQLERWNSDVLALTAPTASQYMKGEVQLAGLSHAPAPLPVDPALAPPPSALHQVAYAAAPAAAAAPRAEAAPALRPATYLKPREDRMTIAPRRIALDTGDFAAELDRLAAAESKKSPR